MAGLDIDGFTPKTYKEINESIGNRLLVVNPKFDLTPESPDGQLNDIMSLELAQAWNELNLVYKSYDPNEAIGAGLRNMGFITGIPYGSATRSSAFVNLVGVAGTIIPKGSIVTDVEDNEFFTAFQATIPSSVQVQAGISGRIPVPTGTINTIKSPVSGWTSVTQTILGREGTNAQTELQFRNTRTRTVMRNFVGIADTIRSRLIELGIEQAAVLSNNGSTPLPDGTPPQAVHVTVGPVAGITDEEIASVILDTKGLGTLTYGADNAIVADTQGNNHTINFTKATAVPIYVSMNITFLSPDIAGAVEDITKDVATQVNGLLTSGDVIWSRLFASITPYGEAQVNTLTIGTSPAPTGINNIVMTDTQFPTLADANIVITVA